ncbi:MAG TPA: hypothetical protein VFB45_22390 [Pseudolabrys sp.]|nr:hypothetical protein [Pseudolabrys sp.]
MQKTDDLDGRARAQRILRTREEMKADAPLAVRDYRAAQRATLARMRELREQRLARERPLKRSD